MSNPILIPFHVEHLRSLVNRDTGQADPWTLAAEKASGGPAVTALLDGRVLGCAGIVLPWPGIGLCWMVLSDAIGPHGIWMTKMVRSFLDDMIRVYTLHRLEAVVLVENERNRRWIERLGFTQENGGARAYTTDRRDIIRYEWVKEG